MSIPIPRTIAAGIGAGLALNITMLLTFRLVGFGWSGGGILLNPNVQSPKLIAVWTKMDPLPLVAANPLPIALGLFIFGIIHAFIYRWLAHSWPKRRGARAWRMGILVFILSFAFWEFFTPFNLFGEPLPLIVLELSFWGAIAFAESWVLAAIMEGQSSA